MHHDEIEVDEQLVRQLLATQMPHLADWPLEEVEPWGTDHAIWRLGDEFVVLSGPPVFRSTSCVGVPQPPPVLRLPALRS